MFPEGNIPLAFRSAEDTGLDRVDQRLGLVRLLFGEGTVRDSLADLGHRLEGEPIGIRHVGVKGGSGLGCVQLGFEVGDDLFGGAAGALGSVAHGVM